MSSKPSPDGPTAYSDASVTAADGAGAEVLDSKHMAQLRALMVGGKSTLFSELSAIFRKEAPARFELLHQAVTTRQLTEVARLSHSFVGSAASIGGRQLQNRMKALELAALAGENASIDKALDEVDHAWDRLHAELLRVEQEDRA